MNDKGPPRTTETRLITLVVVLTGVLGLVVGFFIGYFVGREQLKSEIRSAIGLPRGSAVADGSSRLGKINGRTAVHSIRMLNSAEQNYSAAYGAGFSPNLSSLGPPPDGMPTSALSGFIDSELAGGEKEGYSFRYSPGPKDSQGRIGTYTLNASPQIPDESGDAYYYTDQTGVIRSSRLHRAGASDPPVAE